MAVVVDASAAVELLTRSEAARTIEEAIVPGPAFAPELLDAEVLSALAGLERRGAMSEASARRALAALAGAPITRIPHAGLLAGAWERRANLSLHDAIYVALAARLGCPLVTADARLASSPGLGVTVTLVPSGP